jgi:hypothetical protein
MSHALILATTAGLAARVLAQTPPSFTSDTVLSFPLFWSEVGGNNNGILEPGESAEIRMNVSFTNQFGVAHFAPPIGTFTSGTILGFGFGFLDLVGTGGTAGALVLGNNPGPQTNNGTSGYGIRNGWRIVGNASPGSVNAAGTGVNSIEFGQFPVQVEPVTTNPIPRTYAIQWSPSDYSPRNARFDLAPAGASTNGYTAAVYVELIHNDIGASIQVVPPNVQLGSITIPIAPAPPAAAAIGLVLLARRRRRMGGRP